MRCERFGGLAVGLGVLQTVGINRQAVMVEKERVAEIATDELVEHFPTTLGTTVDHAATAFTTLELVRGAFTHRPCSRSLSATAFFRRHSRRCR